MSYSKIVTVPSIIIPLVNINACDFVGYNLQMHWSDNMINKVHTNMQINRGDRVL